MPDPQPPSPTGQRLHVACLCAAWCRTCDAYADTLRGVVADFVDRGQAHAPRWVDIEDEADLVDELDIETFPTLVVYDAERLRFAGPLTPQPETLRRLLASLCTTGAGPAAADPAFDALVQRLRGG
nr:thioredoxin family protein [Ideonella sp. A 288]